MTVMQYQQATCVPFCFTAPEHQDYKATMGASTSSPSVSHRRDKGLQIISA